MLSDPDYEKRRDATLKRFGKLKKEKDPKSEDSSKPLAQSCSGEQTENNLRNGNDCFLSSNNRTSNFDKRAMRAAFFQSSESIPLKELSNFSNHNRNGIGLSPNIPESLPNRKLPEYFDESDGGISDKETKEIKLKKGFNPYNRKKTQGFIWKCFGLKFTDNFIKRERNNEPFPIFTFWIMTIEIIIMLMLFYSNEFSISFSQQEVSKVIMYQANSYEPASFYEHPNVWYGPSYADLIRIGAKFSPCMRKDKNIMESKKMRNSDENDSGCCMRNDLSLHCVQASHSKCSNRTSYFIKWLDKPGPVCGQDPKYCIDDVAKSQLNFYSINISDWPICNRFNYSQIIHSDDVHMKCKVQARPCCIGIYGKCILASEEYCSFMKGKYHNEASLCSQVDCMRDVCDSFSYPYQIHRLFISLFVHAGLIQLTINIVVQYVYMRRLEQLLGKLRTILIYFISGIGGNLASAVFLPLTPDVGPNAALIGLISFLLYEMFKQKSQYEFELLTLLKIFLSIMILMLPGLFLPFVDIFSIVFGLIYGALIMYICYPQTTNNINNFKQKLLKVFAGIFLIILSLILLVLFYVGENFMENLNITTFTKTLNCIQLPFWNINCSDIDIAYKEIKTLN